MNASDVLKYGNITLQRALSNVPKSEWETQGVCGWWSVKNIIAHLASYELMLVDMLNNFTGSTQDTPTLKLFTTSRGFNDDQVNQRKENSVDATLAEYDAAHRQVMDLIGKISMEKLRELNTLPWYGEEYALDDFLVYTFYGHKREHSAQIEVFKDVLNARK